jgi:SAM-dependent methyltransferase
MTSTTDSPNSQVLDRVREYWDRRPCNIRHSPLSIGTKEYFDEVEARKYFVEPHIPGFAQFDRWKGKRVLEIGCGIGTDTVNFARAGAYVTALDLSEKSVEICRQRLAVYGLNADLHVGNAEELASFLVPQRFDLIYSFGVLHHTPNPGRVIEQLSAYTHPGTELRLMLYTKWCWKVLWIIMTHGKGKFWEWEQLIRQNSEAETGCPVTYVYSFTDLRRLLKGFEVTELRKEHIFPYRINKYIRYEYEPVWYFRWMPKALFSWLEHRLGWHTLAVARPERA